MVSDAHGYGMSKRELERELRWMLRQVPTDPAKLAEFLGDCMVALIDRNNAALARSAAEAQRPDLPERI